MPLYELVCIATRTNKLAPIKTLAELTSSLVVNNGGVVRNIDLWGHRNLPQKMKGNDGSYTSGAYWTMRFDANPPTVALLNERLRQDPRVIRWTTLKVGSKLAEVTAPPEDLTVKYHRAFAELKDESKPASPDMD